MPSSTANFPIPPPSHPKQYRAIGLIEGQYQRSAEKMTRGILTTIDGTKIDTVILGKVISLFKKHIDLDKPHLWVVYPRTPQGHNQLHLQIAGVWQPETLNSSNSCEKTSQDSTASTIPMKSGYFSIRGEVIYGSSHKNIIIIKIRQSPKRPAEKPKFFKLKLKGQLPEKSVGHFWDLQVQLFDNTLIIQTGTDLGYIPKKKPIFRRNQRSPSQFPPRKPVKSSDRSSPLQKNWDRPIPSPRRQPLPKPKKNNSSEP
ncbi:MAG: hypothetical protein AAGF26_17405 [Cyanobacteria bacterium P01_G01_bin.49]